MKRLLLLCITIVLVVSLAACGLGEPERQKKTTKKGQMKIGEMMQENKRHVWLLGKYMNTEKVNGKNEIHRVLVSKNGKYQTYYFRDMENGTVDDLTKMSDDEIIKKAKKEDKSMFNYEKKKLIELTNGEIKETEKLMKQGDDYKAPPTTKSKLVVYGYSDYAQDDGSASPEESMKKLKKYKKELESSEYKEPENKKIDLQYDDNDLMLAVARNYPFPKNSVAHKDVIDDRGLKYLMVQQALQPKNYNGQRMAGVAEDGDTERGEAEFDFLLTKVDKNVKNVLIDEKDDPAIKANKPKEDN